MSAPDGEAQKGGPEKEKEVTKKPDALIEMKQMLEQNRIDELTELLKACVRRSNTSTRIDDPNYAEIIAQAQQYGRYADEMAIILKAHPDQQTSLKMRTRVLQSMMCNPWQRSSQASFRVFDHTKARQSILLMDVKLVQAAQSRDWWSGTTLDGVPRAYYISPTPQPRLIATATPFMVGSVQIIREQCDWSWSSDFNRTPLSMMFSDAPSAKSFVESTNSILPKDTLLEYLSYVTMAAQCEYHSPVLPTKKQQIIFIFRGFNFDPTQHVPPAFLRIPEEKVAKDLGIRRCAVCKNQKNLRKCGRCRSAWFCSVECQKKDWVTHKSSCF